MLYIAFVSIFLSIFLFTYNKNHLSKKNISTLFDKYMLQIMEQWNAIMYFIIPYFLAAFELS